MSKLPTGYEVRAATRGDLEAVANVEAAYDIADYGRPYVDKKWLAEEWEKPRFDPALDAWVVTSPIGDVVAYGQVYEEEPGVLIESLARVHPDHKGLGLGTFLVARTEARAREWLEGVPAGGSLRLLNDVSATDKAAHAVLESAGYTLDRHFWHMWLDLSKPPIEVRPPKNVVLREFVRERDSEAVHSVLQEAFAGHYGYPIEPRPFSEWKELLETPVFVPGLWFVATSGDEIVGALTGRELMGEGWVIEVGVLGSARGRGLGAALLTRAFEAFRARGFTTAALNVDAANETGATMLYERVGMQVRRQWDLYQKILRPG
jgi:GNAT superfamily N-acetyltransferase